MTDDVNARMLDIDQTIPHHLVRKIAIFWQTHRVNLAAPAKVLSAAKVSIRIRKDDVHTSGAHSFACSRPFTPIVVPAHNIFDRVRVLVAIVGARVLILIERPGTIQLPSGLTLFDFGLAGSTKLLTGSGWLGSNDAMSLARNFSNPSLLALIPSTMHLANS